MLKQCSTCNSKQLIDVTNISDETVNYQCWMTETNNKGYKSTERKRVNSSVSGFILKFAISFWSYAAHVHRVQVQQNSFRLIKDSLHDSEIALLIDFSENFVLKDSVQIQPHTFDIINRQSSTKESVTRLNLIQFHLLLICLMIVEKLLQQFKHT